METAPNTIISTCPECKRVLYFSNAGTRMIVCTSCGLVIWRNQKNELQSRPVRVIDKKASIIQPGTTGAWNNKKFTVAGRFRTWFEESVISYWTLIMNDGSINWLEEGYGMYNILQPAESPLGINGDKLSRTPMGNKIELFTGKQYVLEKKLNCLRWEIEGEIYIPETADTMQVYDCAHPGKSYYSFFCFPTGSAWAFEVIPVPFETLQLKNLRSFTYSEKKFTCNNCAEEGVVKTFPLAQSCACKKCGTFYELNNGTDFKLNSKKPAGNENYIYLPLGTKGTIENHEYEIAGFTCKEEMNEYHAQWREYTLFNAEAGYAFLSEFDGHWIFLQEKYEAPALVHAGDESFNYKNEPFRRFNEYAAKVVAAAGEFPYNIFNNLGTQVNEYISPPEIWIQERSGREGITWYFGKHISSNAIQKAFGVSSMPSRMGVGAVQPGYMNIGKIAMATIAGLFFIVLLHTIISKTRYERELFNREFSFSDTADKISVVTEKFDLERRSGNILLQIHAPVRNSWFELGATLVNANTGKEYSLEQGVEYYYGYTDGENWKEGSEYEKAWFKRIPGGTYFLQLEGIREPNSMISGFSVLAEYDVASWRNLWIALILVGIFGIMKFILVYYKERSRWSNSPFSAANKKQEEE